MREVSGDFLSTVYHYSGGISGTGYVSAPVLKDITRVRHRFKTNLCAALDGRLIRIRRCSILIYLYMTIATRADIHGQRKTSAPSAGLGWLCSE